MKKKLVKKKKKKSIDPKEVDAVFPPGLILKEQGVPFIHFSSTKEHQELDDKAVQLAYQVLGFALKPKAYNDDPAYLEEAEEARREANLKIMALNAYSKYKKVISEDPTLVLNKINQLNDKQTRIAEAILKKQKMLDDFKKGKLKLEDVYKLTPKREGKGPKASG